MKSLDISATQGGSPADHLFANRQEGEPNASVLYAAPALDQYRILLVDDDPEILSITRAFLEAHRYAVVSCSSAEDAMNLFTKSTFMDLLITDYQMPGLTGIELARELTSLRPALPVLVVSGSILSNSTEAEMQQRGWHFLAKPWRVPDLLSAVHRTLRPAGEWDQYARPVRSA